MDRETDQLIAALLSDRAYASGRRRFPRTVTKETALKLVQIAHDEVDAGTAARQKSADRDGVVIACGRGCNGCCEEMVMVLEPETQLIVGWLERPENAALRAAFLERYQGWRERVGDGPARLTAAIASGDSEAYGVAHRAQWRKRVLCAFNSGGDCTIYPVRPSVCRNAHAVDTSARCVGDNPEGIAATRLAFKPLDDFLMKARQLELATHAAIGGQANLPEALCEAVARRLQPPA